MRVGKKDLLESRICVWKSWQNFFAIECVESLNIICMLWDRVDVYEHKCDLLSTVVEKTYN